MARKVAMMFGVALALSFLLTHLAFAQSNDGHSRSTALQNWQKYPPAASLCHARRRRLVKINTRLRTDPALQHIFGRQACAEQSVVQGTLMPVLRKMAIRCSTLWI
ncbi:MAG TPA: hypothetical protein VF458_10495 [Ktedonobacteraceae bacterium]